MTTEAELLADLAATYPGLNAKPLREFSHAIPGAIGAHFRASPKGPFMPDGLPIVEIPGPCNDHTDPDGYSCFIHEGFMAWLQARGWYVETYDYGIYTIVPLLTVVDEWRAAQAPTPLCASDFVDSVPF